MKIGYSIAVVRQIIKCSNKIFVASVCVTVAVPRVCMSKSGNICRM